MILAVILITGYSAFLIYAFKQWNQMSEIESTENQPLVTVIVPVRNESQHIAKSLSSILSNHYQNFEVIVINDHSTDDTVAEILKIDSSKIFLIDLKDEIGKKAAVTCAIQKSKGELIICTDGDTYVSNNWIQVHVDAYNLGFKLAFGRVKYIKSRFSDFLNQELAVLISMGAISNRLGHPGMINGCNYSFAKKAFVSVNGFVGNENIPSGDDEFLLRKIHHHYPNTTCFLKNDQTVVETEPPRSFLEFFNQRRRWASKWKKHSDIFSKLSAMTVFLLHFTLIYVLSFGLIYYPIWAVLMIFLRATSEYVLIKTVNSSRTFIPVFLLLQIIYPIYAVFFGLASTFGKYRWRGRTYQI